jgi:hypothetical protein
MPKNKERFLLLEIKDYDTGALISSVGLAHTEEIRVRGDGMGFTTYVVSREQPGFACRDEFDDMIEHIAEDLSLGDS